MKLDFIELAVSDLAASLAWYRDVLGLGVRLCDEAGGFALLVAGSCRLALKVGQPRPGGALLAFEVDDLDAQLARLAGLGVTAEGELKVSPEGYRRARLCDPDGYAVTLFEWSGPAA
jgi:catechol 2,3-dioxygenase-like lactoylglutathione lyase family enzyme